MLKQKSSSPFFHTYNNESSCARVWGGVNAIFSVLIIVSGLSLFNYIALTGRLAEELGVAKPNL